jgi:hypothetical protein
MNECTPAPAVPVPVSPPIEFCAGNKIMRWDGARLTERPRPSPIVDGVYANATIVMQGGCIESISEGTNVVYSACDPCAVPPPPPPTAEVVISPEACNLTTIAPDGGLLTTLTVIPTSNCLEATGCGTTLSPLLLGLRISPDVGNAIECRTNGLFANQVPATTGVNFVGCGITIANGLWTTLATPFAPVLDIISSDGSLTVNRVSDCVIDLTGAVIGGGGVGGLTIINYDTPADLPTTNSANPVATVGTVNPRRLFIFVTGFGWREVFDSTAAALQINL